MKKIALMTTIFAFFSSSTFAGRNWTTLDAAFDNQNQVTISPVEYQGQLIDAGSKNTGASILCKSLGYTRLVRFESNMNKGESFKKMGITNLLYPKNGDMAAFFSKQPILNKRFYTTLKSVTCAK